MVFWGIVVLAVAAVLLLGWRADRRRPGTRITRRNGAVESDIERGRAEVVNRINQPGPFGNG